jgi:hypothetical protein
MMSGALSALDGGMEDDQANDRLSRRRPHGGDAILSRYVLVLDAIAQAACELRLRTIGERTGLPQPTVYRLVQALLHVGFLVQGERGKHYALGPRLLRMLSARPSEGAFPP